MGTGTGTAWCIGGYIGCGCIGLCVGGVAVFGWSIRSPPTACPAEVSLATSPAASRAGAAAADTAPAADITAVVAERKACIWRARAAEGHTISSALGVFA